MLQVYGDPMTDLIILVSPEMGLFTTWNNLQLHRQLHKAAYQLINFLSVNSVIRHSHWTHNSFFLHSL